jgi:hypothetical protein
LAQVIIEAEFDRLRYFWVTCFGDARLKRAR